MNDMTNQPPADEPVVDEALQDIDAEQVDVQDAGFEAADDAASEQPAPPQWSKEAEEEARFLGWKSPDEWQGEKPPGYIDNPEAYLERWERHPVFQKMQKRQDEMLAEQARKIDAVNERAVQRMKEEHQRRIEALTYQQRQAVEEADTEKWERLERAKVDLTRRGPEAPEATPEVSPEDVRAVREYREKNAWAQNPLIWQEAVNAVQFMPRDGDSSAAAQLKFAEDQMRAKYPHLFPDAQPEPRPQPRQRVDAGGLAAGKRGGGRSGFDALPSEAKRVFERQAQQGIWSNSKEDKEEFAREYNNA